MELWIVMEIGVDRGMSGRIFGRVVSVRTARRSADELAQYRSVAEETIDGREYSFDPRVVRAELPNVQGRPDNVWVVFSTAIPHQPTDPPMCMVNSLWLSEAEAKAAGNAAVSGRRVLNGMPYDVGVAVTSHPLEN